MYGKTFVGAYLPHKLAGEIYLISLAYGQSKTDIVETAVNEYLEQLDKKKLYKDVVQGIKDKWEVFKQIHVSELKPEPVVWEFFYSSLMSKFVKQGIDEETAKRLLAKVKR